MFLSYATLKNFFLSVDLRIFLVSQCLSLVSFCSVVYQTIYLITKISKLQTKSFITLGPGLQAGLQPTQQETRSKCGILRSAIWLNVIFLLVIPLSVSETREYQRRKYHCTIDLLFDWFGLVCFANKNKKCQQSYN